MNGFVGGLNLSTVGDRTLRGMAEALRKKHARMEERIAELMSQRVDIEEQWAEVNREIAARESTARPETATQPSNFSELRVIWRHSGQTDEHEGTAGRWPGGWLAGEDVPIGAQILRWHDGERWHDVTGGAR